eukprot:240486_1
MTVNMNWLIGVTLTIVAKVICNLGLNIQKKAHSILQKVMIQSQSHSALQKESETDSDIVKLDKQKSYVCDPLWIFGLFLVIVGAVFDFLALGYAPQSVVAPMGSLTLVVNVMLSPCMHHEKPSLKTLISTAIIISGAVVTVISSPRPDSVESMTQVFELYKTVSFLVYAIFCCGFILIGFALTRYFLHLSTKYAQIYKEKYFKFHRFIIGAIAGLAGAQSVLFAKSVATLLIQSIKNEHGEGVMFVYWQSYLLIVGLFGTIYLQIKWLNDGLKSFSALHITPLFQAFWTSVGVIGGLTVYREFESMDLWQMIIFPMGVIVTIIGVICLAMQGKQEQYDTNDMETVQMHDIDV